MRRLLATSLLVLSAACASSASPSDDSDDALTRQSENTGHVCTDPASFGSALPCAKSAGTPQLDFAPSLIDNSGLFTDEFYKRFTLRHASAPMRLSDSLSRDYVFPTLYRDVTTSMAMFFCSKAKAKALMPDDSMEPVDMGFGRTLVIFTSYRYNRIHGMEPYNEVGVAIPVVQGRLLNVPVVPLLLSDFKGLGFYLLSMPVTASENDIRGHELWGIPKVVEEIDLAVDGDDYVTTVKEPSGEPYLEFRVPMQGEAKHIDNRTYVYSVLDGNLVRTESRVLADFQINKWLSTLTIPHLSPSRTYLTLGDTPAGRKLQDLDIEAHPFQVRYTTAAESALDLPDPTFQVPLKK